MNGIEFAGFVSLVCLFVTAALATWGVFSKHFDDSLLQCIGMSFVAVACILRIPDKLVNPTTPTELLFAQIGLCIYGIGTAIKLYNRRKDLPRERRRGYGVGI